MNHQQQEFQKSLQQSIGDLYKDFYSQKALNHLSNELYSIYQNNQQKNIHILKYTPTEEDPLIRINITCVAITCQSLPFFTSRIRKYFNEYDFAINRSIHFHPDQSHEMYYVEVRHDEKSILDQLINQLKDSYEKIVTCTEDYRTFRQNEAAPWFSGWNQKQKELLDWFIHKGSLWEGAYFEKDGHKQSFGFMQLEGNEWDWFQNIQIQKDDIGFYTRNTNTPSFLAEEDIIYFAFLNPSQKLLIKASLSQNAQNAGMQEIPIYCNYLEDFMKNASIQNYSGLGRTVRMMFNYIPKEVLLVIPRQAYPAIYSAIIDQSLKSNIRSSGIHIQNELHLVISFIPEKNWSEEKWNEVPEIIESICPGAFQKNYHVFRGNYIETFQIIHSKSLNRQKLFELSSRIEFNFRSWMDNLYTKWEDRYNDEPIVDILFPSDYKTTHNAEMAIGDISRVRKLGNERLLVEVKSDTEDNTILSAITHKKEFRLSDWVLALNHLGLSPISQRVYHFSYNQQNYAKTEFFFESMEDQNSLYLRLKDAFSYTMKGILPSDMLSGILIKTRLDVNGLFFLKAIRDYCMQTNSHFHVVDFNETLLKFPEFCSAAWDYFYTKFQQGQPATDEHLQQLCEKSTTLKEDEVLHSFRSVLTAILRTNFFGLGSKEIHKEKTGITGIDRQSIAFKINSSIPVSLPQPRPYREIYVYSANFQGIHLRGGSVARGGLRFSDRSSDYRTEVLSLMKTQMVKNALIVPVGSKGGFVLSKNKFQSGTFAMVEAYKSYINSLIALTDNQKKGQIIPFAEPNGPYAYDETDPYLVVAADKGTAQLSDTANSLSEAQGFWLADAFASGGSRGYSHKELGITARGALVTADRLFRNLNIDFRNEPVTIIAIGDMGGDVFGNGLLDSKYFKLVAAFNHKHIFIDPNPDVQTSYQERQRLFQSEQSGWENYNTRLLSRGGGVYDRNEKSIRISPEAKLTLAITEDSLSGIELIRCILKAPVDMFYNGGIGTYVKSEQEENTKVGDPANNDLRINASELRAKVVSEGGNLGFTQKGRIEFAQKGGNIYTDALDNSGGVDLSDHEVNLKLFFGYLKEHGKIADDNVRDQLMKEIANDVVDKVLRNNALQSLTINVDHYESEKLGWKNFQQASHYLIGKKLLNPITETIPATNHEWHLWQEKSAAIPRPALCILMGYVKMDLYSACLEKQVFDAEQYENVYLDYFPEKIVSLYRQDLFNHPLRTEIITTQLINFFINLMGITGILMPGLQESNRILYLQQIIDEFQKLELFELLNELAVVRKKQKEAEIIDFTSEIREKMRKKFTHTSGGQEIYNHQLVEELSTHTRMNLQKLV